MDENKTHTQEELKEMWAAAKAAEPPLKHITFFSVIGGPGSGKALHANLLAQHFDFKHISVPSAMRDEMSRPSSPLAAAIQRAQAEDRPNDQRLVVQVLRRRLEEAVAHGDKTIILIGFPRDVDGLECFEHAVAPIRAVLYLAHPEDALFERLQERGRAGDTPALIRQRLVAFHNQTLPLLRHLEVRSSRARMFFRVIAWADDDRLAVDARFALQEALKVLKKERKREKEREKEREREKEKMK